MNDSVVSATARGRLRRLLKPSGYVKDFVIYCVMLPFFYMFIYLYLIISFFFYVWGYVVFFLLLCCQVFYFEQGQFFLKVIEKFNPVHSLAL